MKKLDLYVLKSFIRPLIPTLGIMVFFFLMQMVWKYVDDLAGKGIEWYVLLPTGCAEGGCGGCSESDSTKAASPKAQRAQVCARP